MEQTAIQGCGHWMGALTRRLSPRWPNRRMAANNAPYRCSEMSHARLSFQRGIAWYPGDWILLDDSSCPFLLLTPSGPSHLLAPTAAAFFRSLQPLEISRSSPQEILAKPPNPIALRRRQLSPSARCLSPEALRCNWRPHMQYHHPMERWSIMTCCSVIVRLREGQGP